MTDVGVDAVRHLVGELAARPVDPLVATSVVVDRLLDLRNAAGTEALIIDVIDTTLADIPGATTTTGAWWRDQLEFLRNLTETIGPGSGTDR